MVSFRWGLSFNDIEYTNRKKMSTVQDRPTQQLFLFIGMLFSLSRDFRTRKKALYITARFLFKESKQ